MSAGVGELPAGSSVAVLGGRQVHLVVRAGAGTPVLFLGGCGVPWYAWQSVLDLLSARPLVCLDRPGLVQTPWPGVLPELRAEVRTLADLLERIGAPAVVAAHSMASFHAEGLIRRRPAAVAGLVLVDGSVEWEPRSPSQRVPWRELASAAQQAMRFRPLRPGASFGERVLVASQSRRLRVFDPVPPVARDTYRRPDTVASVIAEQGAYAQQAVDLAALRKTTSWPGTPTVVLTAAAGGARRQVPAQARLAALLGGRQVVVEDSRHLMMVDRPDVVVEAVRSLDAGG